MITVAVQTESHFPVDRKKIRDAVVRALTGKVHRETEVGVSIAGDRLLRRLNKKYRSLDETTDVLSFSLNESAKGVSHFINPPDDVLRLGDIVVSYPQAVVEASQEQKMVDDKIVELVLHGLNHLLGIHHD